MSNERKVLCVIAGFSAVGVIWALIRASAIGVGFQVSTAIPAFLFGVIVGVGIVTPCLVIQKQSDKSEKTIEL